MKAAICYAFGQPLVVEEVDIDPPQREEVRVRLVATGICHSDVHLIRGDWGGALPVVAGHEAAGIVEEVGPGVTLAKPGDRVVVSLLRACGRCFYCTTGSPYFCEGVFALQTESRLCNKQGQRLRQGIKVASFAEQVIVHQSQVVPLPADMPLDRAALLACGVITGFGAVVNTAKVRPGESVVVIGVGGVGMNAIQGAVVAGAHPIIAMDVLDAKAKLALSFGATHALNARQANAEALVRELTSGRGVDYVVVAVGNTAAVEQGFRMIRREGTLVIAGIPHQDATFALPVGRCVNNGLRILGSSMGATRLSVEVPRLVELYKHGRLKLDELITARYPLERINEAIVAMETGETLRNVIVFG